MKYVDTQKSLSEACAAIASSPWAAVDSEADSLHHYAEKLCLLQVSIPGEDFIIDPLLSLDLQPLMQILSRKPLILHGADFDIRILKRSYGFVPREVFDTMIAAQLLGYEKQGLADLALRHCGAALSKVSQKADWSKRPLGEELIAYAWKDTHYLKPISLKMESELAALGRLDWHRQCCERLIAAATRTREGKVHVDYPWQIKGSRKLSGKALAVLKELWAWREEEAKRRDRPVFKILHSETLIEVAQWAAEHPGADVALLPGAPRNVKGEHRSALNRLIEKARAFAPLRYVEKVKPNRAKRPDAESQKTLAALKGERQRIAAELKIHQGVLVTNASLEALARESPETLQGLAEVGSLMPWQTGVLGESFLKILKAGLV